jgi:hypothetical protein
VIEKDAVILLSKKILSGQSKVAHILYQLNLVQRNTNVESDPSQVSTAVGNEGNVSNNSQAPVNSGHEKAKENNKGKKNKFKKKKGGKKGNK